MSPLAFGVIGVRRADLRKLLSGAQIDVAGGVGSRLLRLAAALARLLATLALLLVALDAREVQAVDRRDGPPGLDRPDRIDGHA